MYKINIKRKNAHKNIVKIELIIGKLHIQFNISEYLSIKSY